jgi:hypothetical protein
MSDISREVKVGGETRTIRKFKSFRAIVAGAIIGDVVKDWSALLEAINEWRADYREKNKVQITRQEAVERAAALRADAETLRARSDDDLPDGVSRDDAEARARLIDSRAESWDRTVTDMGDQGYIEFPSDPSEGEIIAFGLPLALQKMLPQVVGLIGLALIPEAELKAAWRKDDAVAKISDYGYGQLEEMELGEEVEVALAVWEVAQEQLRPRMEAVAKLQGLLNRQPALKKSSESESPTTSKDESPSESPTSSTPSQPPTDGTPSEPSSDSTTEPTSPSLAA